MDNLSKFVIQNGMGKTMILNIEPEGAFFRLCEGQEVSVTDVNGVVPVTLTITCGDDGEPILSIWPGDGEVKVKKDGVDVLDLLQAHGVSSPPPPRP